MNFGLKESLLQDIIGVISKYPDIKRAVIFGSRARGDYRYNSDIDIAVFTSQDTQVSGSLLFDLEELDCLYRFDVVDAGTVNNANLLNVIEVQGVEIFSR
jgi:predicted nucleotidyltransferase